MDPGTCLYMMNIFFNLSGITAASGIAAVLGIPLTHRGVANSVRFLTGHSRKGGTDPLFVAENAADPDSTLVVYMGLSTLPSLAQKLVHHGLPPNTPAVAVERGTTPQQRMVRMIFYFCIGLATVCIPCCILVVFCLYT